MLAKWTLSTIFAVTLALGAACSSSSGDDNEPASCTTNPWSCAAGTTCWADANGTFSCLPSGTKLKGETCAPIGGQADCADALFCFQNLLVPGSAPSCVSYCDAAHPCGANEACAQASIQGTGATVNICVTQGPTPDGGGAGGAGGSAGGSGSGGAGAEAGSGPVPPVDGG
jgi:hypothetical protein